jgi:hypothetical protein
MLVSLPSLWLMFDGLGRGNMIVGVMLIGLLIWFDGVIQVVLLSLQMIC